MSLEPRTRKVLVLNPDGEVIIPADGTPYDSLIDEGATYTYIGKALPGTLTSASTWRIFRITNATGVLRHADGVSTFTKKWDDRATYTYG